MAGRNMEKFIAAARLRQVTVKHKPIHFHNDTMLHCLNFYFFFLLNSTARVCMYIKFITLKLVERFSLRKSCQFKNENLYTDIQFQMWLHLSLLTWKPFFTTEYKNGMKREATDGDMCCYPSCFLAAIWRIITRM